MDEQDKNLQSTCKRNQEQDQNRKQDKSQMWDQCSLFGAEAMKCYVFRPRNITLTIQIPHFFG